MMMLATTQVRLLSLLTAAFLFAGTFSTQAAPVADPGGKWAAHNAASTHTIDHGAWDEFLFRHMRQGADGIGRIDYGCVTPSEHASLKGYIRSLTQVPVSSLNRDEQFAYWVNLYNALTVDLVLHYYPISSIRDIQIGTGMTGFFGDLIFSGPWREPLVQIDGTPLSLDDIEHNILRPIWKEPKVHFAVNCAAIGCPNLQGAFTAENTRTLLHKGAWDYVNHPRGVQASADGVKVSDLFVWYEEDFGDGTPGSQRQGLIKHLKTYAKPDLAEILTTALAEGKPLTGMGYDWRLNDAACGAY